MDPGVGLDAARCGAGHPLRAPGARALRGAWVQDAADLGDDGRPGGA